MNWHAMEWMNLKVNVLIELAVKLQDLEHQEILFTTQVLGNS
jgi:hypothetical protein